MSQHHTSGRQGQSPRRRNNNSYGKQGRSSSGNRRPSNGNRRPFREPRPAKLSFWQKILKMIGLHKPVAAPAKKTASEKTTTEKRTNIRIAKSKSEGRAPVSKAPVSAPRLYVGNLSYEATESDLEDLFKGIGGVRSVEVIYNPRTHKSKGYAFVEMQFMDDAVRAVQVLHDQPFMGRLLTVSAANERQENNEADDDSQSSMGAGFDPDDVAETQNS